MSLQELSCAYEASAVLLRSRLKYLRARLKKEQDAAARRRLERRIAAMTPILTEMNALAELTAHYYDRGYYRDEAYTL